MGIEVHQATFAYSVNYDQVQGAGDTNIIAGK